MSTVNARRQHESLARPDVLVVGAGPAGAAAAILAAQAGFEVLVIDAAVFPRDKTCGDGLTPRALHQLRKLGLAEAVLGDYRNRGLKLHGFSGDATAAWPAGPFGQEGSARPRAVLDAALLGQAARAGATVWHGARAAEVAIHGGRITRVTVRRATGFAAFDPDCAAAAQAGASAVSATGAGETRDVELRPHQVIVADGVRSEFGKLVGRRWHREQVYGIAARSYCTTPWADEPWIHSHLELRDARGELQPGYGWIFPLGDGQVNLGCGALSTSARPAKVNTKKLLRFYAAQQATTWELSAPEHVTSALLPMGGAVSNVAGRNWMLIGDAAGLVNPLNGEGIDYALESAELAAGLLSSGAVDFTWAWPGLLRERYGAAFSLARMLARALTHPGFLPVGGPIAMGGPQARVLMPVAARLMGNLVSDSDRDVVARLWRGLGRVARATGGREELWGRSL